jgi:hypothetical protein
LYYCPSPPLTRSGNDWLVQHVVILEWIAYGRSVHAALILPHGPLEADIALLGSSFPDARAKVLGKAQRLTPHTFQRLYAALSIESSEQTSEARRPNREHQHTGPGLLNNFAIWSGMDARPHLAPSDMVLTPNFQRPKASHPPSLDAVALDAILWAGYGHPERPPVLEAYTWDHGLFMAATAASEQTTISRDSCPDFDVRAPLASQSQSSWQQWVCLGVELRRSRSIPRVFQINLLHRRNNGTVHWAPEKEHLEAMQWLLDRMTVGASETATPLGKVPPPPAQHSHGGVRLAEHREAVNSEFWLTESNRIESTFRALGNEVPDEMWGQLETLKEKIIYGT